MKRIKANKILSSNYIIIALFVIIISVGNISQENISLGQILLVAISGGGVLGLMLLRISELDARIKKLENEARCKGFEEYEEDK